VYAALKFARERGVDHAMTFESGLSAEGVRHDIETEMSLAARPMPGMAFMVVRFVFDAQTLWRESLVQLFCDDIRYTHRFEALASASRRGQSRNAPICRLSSLAGDIDAPA
jgi:hypothetical protein